MVVFVINKNGRALMPCSVRKARILLKKKKAKIYCYKPFTIKLLYGSYGYTQPTRVGVEIGARCVGIAVSQDESILAKGEITLRNDVKQNLQTRKLYRRSRRNRKTRYRQERFFNRIKSRKDGWLPPSIRSRIDNTFMWIDKFIGLVPNPTLSIELGKNENEFLEKKDTTFMYIIKRHLIRRYPHSEFTYKDLTTLKRLELDLEKTYYNNAIAISGVKKVSKNKKNIFKIVQFRKKKRSLHEANPRKGRKTKNVLSKRNEKNRKQIKNWCLNDAVRVFGKTGFICGFTGSAACYVKDIDGKYITPVGKNYKQVNLSSLKLMRRNNNWQYGCVPLKP